MKVRPASPGVIQPLTGLSPLIRRFLLVGIDGLLLPLTVWLSFWLRLAHPFHSSFIATGNWLLPAVVLVGLPFYAFTGQTKASPATWGVLPFITSLSETDFWCFCWWVSA